MLLGKEEVLRGQGIPNSFGTGQILRNRNQNSLIPGSLNNRLKELPEELGGNQHFGTGIFYW